MHALFFPQSITKKNDFKIENFASLVDGKGIWFLLDYYFRREVCCPCLHEEVWNVLNLNQFQCIEFYVGISLHVSYKYISCYIFLNKYLHPGSWWSTRPSISDIQYRLSWCSSELHSVAKVDSTFGKFSWGNII